MGFEKWAITIVDLFLVVLMGAVLVEFFEFSIHCFWGFLECTYLCNLFGLLMRRGIFECLRVIG